jgi:hypothetical protein
MIYYVLLHNICNLYGYYNINFSLAMMLKLDRERNLRLLLSLNYHSNLKACLSQVESMNFEEILNLLRFFFVSFQGVQLSFPKFMFMIITTPVTFCGPR